MGRMLVGLLALGLSAALAAPRPYTVVGTGQTRCYSDRGELAPPSPGQPFYGQDAQHPGPAPSYRDNGDGTVSDLVTGLTWVKARGAKRTWDQALAGAAACRVGGFADWRAPTIKELYSLINFDGYCAGRLDNSQPYLDARAFEFVYGDTAQGVRLIDCQDWSATKYVATTMGGDPTVFGVNFADGRIKGYPQRLPGGREGHLYMRYVRGNPAYGRNDFHDNGDGTITDRATGLMWSRNDGAQAVDWRTALAWVQKENAGRYLGRSDWRLPNAKELQSLVDYTRSPSTTQSPAISPLFRVTPLPGGDYPCYWTSTTHLDGPADRRGSAAVYVAFGCATGWMRIPPGAGEPRLLDVHGAGAQRSDPKSGDPRDYPYGRGPQGDVVRIYNQVRLVRDCTD